MNKLSNFFVMFFLSVVFLTSCNKENTKEAGKGNVQFAVGGMSSLKSMVATDSTGGNDTTRNYYYALVTIENNYGEVIYNSKLITIYSFGGQFISESLSLETGNYRLTQFAILKGSDVKYVTPIQYSERAQLIEHPLPISFVISEGVNTQVNPEVLAVESYPPQAFGYTSFSFSIVKTLFFKVIAYGGDSLSSDSTAIPAYLQVNMVSDTILDYAKILQYNLSPTINKIEINESPFYMLHISQMGYYSWSERLSLDQIKAYSNEPLRVHLNKLSNDSIYIVKP